jgi:hypothetical protein
LPSFLNIQCSCSFPASVNEQRRMAIRSLTFFCFGPLAIHAILAPSHATSEGAGKQHLSDDGVITRNKVQRDLRKNRTHPKDCGLNPAEPDRPRPGCDSVVCEAIQNQKDCAIAKEHGHHCRWGGDETCRTPPHLRRASEGKVYGGSDEGLVPFGSDVWKDEPKNCGLNPKEPDHPRPGCETVKCEDIDSKEDCRTAKMHGHHCRWGGDRTCRTPPHLRRASQGSVVREEDDSVLAGIVRFICRAVLILVVVASLALCCACFFQGPVAVRRALLNEQVGNSRQSNLLNPQQT